MSGAQKQAQQDELIGQVINDRFRILSAIARGGMGRVYRAEQVPLGRLVAIKTLDPRQHGTDGDPQFQQRFFLEASVASKLQHPNTVTVFDYGRTAEGIFFIAMELVEGRSLLAAIRDAGRLESSRVIHIAMQIARSLREAHRLDVIHRDLKPGNVLLTQHADEDDFVKVLDFGLVKHVETEQQQELTKAGLFMGSPKYMAPEQIRGERVDARCDVYALGVCMYEMLTGKVPFDRENTVKILMAHMHEVPAVIQDPSVLPGLKDLVMRCLAKKPEDRPASMDEVILGLKQATGGPILMSGSYPLGSPAVSQTLMRSGTPSQPFVASTHPNYAGTPSTAFASGGGGFTPGGGMHIPQGTPIGAAMPNQFSQQPAPPGSSWLPRVAVLGALAIAGGFLALKFTERDPMAMAARLPPVTEPLVPAPSATQPAAVAPTPPPQVQAPVVAVPDHVMVKLTSTPSGATVKVDGKEYTTPADVEWTGELASVGRTVTFLFEAEGYEPSTVQRIVRGNELAVDAMLAKSAPVRRIEPKRVFKAPETKAPAAGPVVIQKNFKEDPY